MPNTPEPFGGFEFTPRTFHVKATDFKIIRRWSRSRFIGGGEDPQFSLVITGSATAKDGVCVIGATDDVVREFRLVLLPDRNAKEKWEWHRAHDISVGDEPHTPERRIKNRRNEMLDQCMRPVKTAFPSGASREMLAH